MADKAEPERKPAGDNPWYVLMTVAGPHTGEGLLDIDWYLHARNRRYWNSWAAQVLDNDEKAKLVADGRVTEADIAPLTEGERAAIDRALAERVPDAEPPNPKDCPRLYCIEVRTVFCAANFLFPRGANFQRTTFSDSAFFGSATFSDSADFQSAKFSGPAEFRSATFSDTANFSSATFSDDVFLQNVAFSARVDFLSSTFSGRTFFRRTEFLDIANFSNASFKAATSFSPLKSNRKFKGRGARFARPPMFFNATLHEDTDWTDVVWPDPPKDRDEAIEFRRAYERLKLLMADQNKFADEHFFLRKELECREIEEPGSLRTWASKAFGLLADYGWSVERPVIAIGVVWIVGWTLMFLVEWRDYWLGAWPDCIALPEPERAGCPRPEYLGFWQGAALSFSNLFAFLGLGLHIMRDELASLTAFSEVVAGAQMVAGPILLFLLALGLRNRFRIK